MLRPLEELGYKPRVLALDPESCEGPFDPGLTELLPSDLDVRRVPASERKLWYRALVRCFPSIARLPDKHAPVHFRAVRGARRILDQHPATIMFSWAQSHSCSLVALELKRSLGIPWVAHLSDPWLGGPYWDGGRARRWIIGRLERAVLDAADAVVFVSEETREMTMSRYHPDWMRKTHVIPHCFDPRLYPTADHATRNGAVIRHIGSLYGPRRPTSLFDAIQRLEQSEPALLEGVRIELVGDRATALAGEIARRGLGGLVEARPGVGYLESLREMRTADVLVLIEAPAATSLFLPSKLIDYLGANRPILALTPSRGPSASILTEPLDRVVPPDDVAAIALALKDLIERAKRGDLDGFRRSADVMTRFSSRSTVATLAGVFDRVLEDRTIRE
jgi:glycosyltransferase involved in cell wall biosynthesis